MTTAHPTAAILTSLAQGTSSIEDIEKVIKDLFVQGKTKTIMKEIKDQYDDIDAVNVWHTLQKDNLFKGESEAVNQMKIRLAIYVYVPLLHISEQLVVMESSLAPNAKLMTHEEFTQLALDIKISLYSTIRNRVTSDGENLKLLCALRGTRIGCLLLNSFQNPYDNRHLKQVGLKSYLDQEIHYHDINRVLFVRLLEIFILAKKEHPCNDKIILYLYLVLAYAVELVIKEDGQEFMTKLKAIGFKRNFLAVDAVEEYDMQK